MAINFMKNIFENNVDSATHEKFIRYGKGEFEKEEIIIKVGSMIQLWAGFEYVDVLYRIFAQIVSEPVSVKGVIISKKDIRADLISQGIEPKKITGKKYTIEEELEPDRFKAFVDKFSEYPLLVNSVSGKNQIKTKKSVPKPGKLIEKFVSAKFEKGHLGLIQEEFLFDVKEAFKQANVRHAYRISDIIVDDSLIEKDPARARLEAKRKGTCIRKLTVDGKEETKEKDMMV